MTLLTQNISLDMRCTVSCIRAVSATYVTMTLNYETRVIDIGWHGMLKCQSTVVCVRMEEPQVVKVNGEPYTAAPLEPRCSLATLKAIISHYALRMTGIHSLWVKNNTNRTVHRVPS